MARRRDSQIAKALTSVLPRQRIRELAAKLGVVRRRRKLDVVAFVYSLVLGFGAGDRRTLGGLRRCYLRATGVRLAPSSFYDRFNAALVKLFRVLCLEALERLARDRPKMQSVFAPFREVLAVDCTLLRLHNALEPLYPSVYSHYMKASAKLCMVMNVIGRGAKSIAISHGSRHDVHMLQAGPWMKGRLLIFDLGFFRAALFHQIARNGGYFLTRMRKHGNPVIVRSHKRAHQDLVGFKLCDAQQIVGDAVLDVDAEMGFAARHRERPFVTNHRVSYRCVAIYNHELKQWHRYITNVPPAVVHAEHMTAIYAARWEVELLFRELKKTYRIEHMASVNRYVSETLIYAALLTLVMSRALLRALYAHSKIPRWRLPLDRWSKLMAAAADQLLALILSGEIDTPAAQASNRFSGLKQLIPTRPECRSLFAPRWGSTCPRNRSRMNDVVMLPRL